MFQFNTIEKALEDLKKGKIILATDDPDRENEGDFICAAEFATTANINFMATHGKGLICMPMSKEYVDRQPRDSLHRLHRLRRDHHRHLRGGAIHDRAKMRR